MSDIPRTFEEYITQTSWSGYGALATRAGQRYMNVLDIARPDLATFVRANDLDPYYLDERIPMFLEFVMRHWEPGEDT